MCWESKLNCGGTSKVVHFWYCFHASVTKSPDFSYVCPRNINLFNEINGLKKCLKNRQTLESSGKQGNFRGSENFSAMLSTESGDSFPLALAQVSLQQTRRIDDSGRSI
jgi:hypothetical protein